MIDSEVERILQSSCKPWCPDCVRPGKPKRVAAFLGRHTRFGIAL